MKTPVRALQPGQVLHTGAGRWAVLHVAAITPEHRLAHLVLGRVDGHVPPAERIHVAHWPADARVEVQQDPAVEWLLELTRQLSDLVATLAAPPAPVGDVRPGCILINNPPKLGD
jgi:hypothetical protein